MEIKLYQITGYFVKNRKKIPLHVECRASKIEDALERVFSEIGSRHRVKREEIFVTKDTGIIEIERSSKPIFNELDKEDFKILAGSR
ncbi:MAG: 50S ribosomal protein L18Ae [Candidatus Kariarchaeaceae archaeon]